MGFSLNRNHVYFMKETIPLSPSTYLRYFCLVAEWLILENVSRSISSILLVRKEAFKDRISEDLQYRLILDYSLVK